MTITVSFAAVADNIAGLAMTPVTVKDIDQIPDNAELLCPILFPQPSNFVSDILATHESFGSNGTPKINMNYTLNYVFLHAKTGGVGQYEAYAGLIANLEIILESILSNDALASAIDNMPSSIQGIGIVEDPTGNQYWGALLSFRILEYTQ